MAEHDRVERLEPIASDDDYLYLVHRVEGLPDIKVHLSDAYEYTRAEYLARPDEVTESNSFIVLGLPHSHGAAADLVAEMKADRIGIGKVGKFMGALTRRNVWEYESPEERIERERRR